MYQSDARTEKWTVEVEVMLDDGTKMLGFLFVAPLHRISELLNDDRQFLPFRHPNGRIELLRKISINKVSELNQNVDLDAVIDPYEILGVSRDINDTDLRSTYRQRCLQNHPDRLASLNLAPEIVSFAGARLARIINAHRQVQEKRKISLTKMDCAG